MTIDNTQDLIQKNLQPVIEKAEVRGWIVNSPYANPDAVRIASQDLRAAQDLFLNWMADFITERV